MLSSVYNGQRGQDLTDFRNEGADITSFLAWSTKGTPDYTVISTMRGARYFCKMGLVPFLHHTMGQCLGILCYSAQKTQQLV